MNRVRACLLGIGALAMSGLLSGCIYVDRGGHGGGRHCEGPVYQPVYARAVVVQGGYVCRR